MSQPTDHRHDTLTGAGVIYLILMMGTPDQAAGHRRSADLVNPYAILKSLFIRGRDEDPGLR